MLYHPISYTKLFIRKTFMCFLAIPCWWKVLDILWGTFGVGLISFKRLHGRKDIQSIKSVCSVLHSDLKTCVLQPLKCSFCLLSGCPTTNFGPLLRGQPQLSYVNHCVFYFRPEGHQKLRNEVGHLSLVEHLVVYELGKLLINSHALTHWVKATKWIIQNVKWT